MSKIVKSKVTASKAAVPKKALTQKPVETDDESSADSSPASTLASDASDSSDAEDVASAAESDSDDSAESSSEEESSDDDEEIDVAALAASAASRLTQLARASTPSAAAGISTSDILGISSSSAGPVNATARFFVPSSSGSVSLVTAFTATASAADSAAATGAAAAASGSSYVFTTSTLRSTASDPLKALEARVAELQETVGGETGVASKDERRAAAKAAKKDTAGKRWYDLPATEMTPEMKRDLLILRHRGVLDPSKHYRRETSELPKYFQIGTVIAGNAEPNNTKSRRERKRTLVEEVLGDAEAVEHLRSRADNTRAKEARRTGGPARRGRK